MRLCLKPTGKTKRRRLKLDVRAYDSGISAPLSLVLAPLVKAHAGLISHAVGLASFRRSPDSGKFLLEGADNPGIVHKVTSALAKHGLSIDKMETGQDIAPHGGTVLFTMRGIVNAAAPLAAGFDIAQTKEDLMALGDSLNCEVTVEDVHEGSDASFFAG